MDGGLVNLTGTTFSRLNNSDGSDVTSIQVINGGQIGGSGCEFNWDFLTLGPGANKNPGGLTDCAFDTTVTLSAVDLFLLASNRHFQNIDFPANDSVTNGQAVTLGPMGTDTAQYSKDRLHE